MVERVISIDANLHLVAVLVQVERLSEREIEVLDARPVDVISAVVAKGSACRSSENCRQSFTRTSIGLDSLSVLREDVGVVPEEPVTRSLRKCRIASVVG